MSCGRRRLPLVGSLAAAAAREHEVSFTCSTRFQSFTFFVSRRGAIEMVSAENSSRYLSLSLGPILWFVVYGWDCDDASTMTAIDDVDNDVGNLDFNVFVTTTAFLGSSNSYTGKNAIESERVSRRCYVYTVRHT